jgi:hypothetical protein
MTPAETIATPASAGVVLPSSRESVEAFVLTVEDGHFDLVWSSGFKATVRALPEAVEFAFDDLPIEQSDRLLAAQYRPLRPVLAHIVGRFPDGREEKIDAVFADEEEARIVASRIEAEFPEAKITVECEAVA